MNDTLKILLENFINQAAISILSGLENNKEIFVNKNASIEFYKDNFNDLLFRYYDDNKIKRIEAQVSNYSYNGLYKSFRNDGVLDYEAEYLNDALNGIKKEYCAGQLVCATLYSNDKKIECLNLYNDCFNKYWKRVPNTNGYNINCEIKFIKEIMPNSELCKRINLSEWIKIKCKESELKEIEKENFKKKILEANKLGHYK